MMPPSGRSIEFCQMKAGMKGSSLTCGLVGMGSFKGFPSSSPWTTPRGESQMGKGKNTAEELGWETRALAEEGLFCQAKEFEFYPEGHGCPWEFVGKLRGLLTTGFHSTPSEQGDWFICGWNQERASKYGYGSYAIGSAPPQLHFCVPYVSTEHPMRPRNDHRVLCGHQADTFSWGLGGESQREVVSAMCIKGSSSGAVQTKVLSVCPWCIWATVLISKLNSLEYKVGYSTPINKSLST